VQTGKTPGAAVRRRFVIEGRVQMVGFRAFATIHATSLGLRGWVRNTESGAVEVLAEGTRSSVDELARLLRRGPAAAEVTAFSVFSEAADDDLTDFRPVA
jgi:acylphosphatase